MPKKRPATSVCQTSTATCIAFAGDPIWTVQNVLDQGNEVFGVDGFRIIVVPVRRCHVDPLQHPTSTDAATGQL